MFRILTSPSNSEWQEYRRFAAVCGAERGRELFSQPGLLNLDRVVLRDR